MYRNSSIFSISLFRSRVLAWSMLTILVFSFVPSVGFAQQPTATISVLNGTVLVNGQAGSPGIVLTAGDVIETQAGARVVLEFSDGSLLELAENTKLDMAELGQTATGARVSRVKLMWGWIRAKLSPGHQQAGSSFDIETPNALVGVKFSQPDVEVSYDPDKQETIGLARTVALSARNLMTDEELIVPVGSTVIITTTTIKIVAGLLSLGKASDAIMEADTSQTKMPETDTTGTEATGVESTKAEAAATGAEATATGTTGAGTTATIGGLSATTLALVGLGVVAVGGGVAAIAGGSGDGDEGTVNLSGYWRLAITINQVCDHLLGSGCTPTMGYFFMDGFITQSGNGLSGSLKDSEGQTYSVTGEVNGSSVWFTADEPDGSSRFDGQTDGNTLQGDFSGSTNIVYINGERTPFPDPVLTVYGTLTGTIEK
jgi:hypothetical protein